MTSPIFKSSSKSTGFFFANEEVCLSQLVSHAHPKKRWHLSEIFEMFIKFKKKTSINFCGAFVESQNVLNFVINRFLPLKFDLIRVLGLKGQVGCKWTKGSRDLTVMSVLFPDDGQNENHYYHWQEHHQGRHVALHGRRRVHRRQRDWRVHEDGGDAEGLGQGRRRGHRDRVRRQDHQRLPCASGLVKQAEKPQVYQDLPAIAQNGHH